MIMMVSWGTIASIVLLALSTSTADESSEDYNNAIARHWNRGGWSGYHFGTYPRRPAIWTHSVKPPIVMTPRPLSGCNGMVDIVFAVDGSDSISAGNFACVKRSLVEITNRLRLSEDGVRCGLAVNSNQVTTNIPMTANKEQFQTMVSELMYPRGATRTDLGIKAMRNIFGQQGRPGVLQMGIVITNGISKYPIETSIQASLNKAQNINMFCVGVANTIVMEELKMIASDESEVMAVASFDEMTEELPMLLKRKCPSVLTIEYPTSETILSTQHIVTNTPVSVTTTKSTISVSRAMPTIDIGRSTTTNKGKTSSFSGTDRNSTPPPSRNPSKSTPTKTQTMYNTERTTTTPSTEKTSKSLMTLLMTTSTTKAKELTTQSTGMKTTKITTKYFRTSVATIQTTKHVGNDATTTLHPQISAHEHHVTPSIQTAITTVSNKEKTTTTPNQEIKSTAMMKTTSPGNDKDTTITRGQSTTLSTEITPLCTWITETVPSTVSTEGNVKTVTTTVQESTRSSDGTTSSILKEPSTRPHTSIDTPGPTQYPTTTVHSRKVYSPTPTTPTFTQSTSVITNFPTTSTVRRPIISSTDILVTTVPTRTTVTKEHASTTLSAESTTTLHTSTKTPTIKSTSVSMTPSTNVRQTYETVTIPRTTPNGITTEIVTPGPGECDNCKLLNGAGYKRHPTDCHKYIQCYFGENDYVQAVYRECPFGQYWDHDLLTCQLSSMVDCPIENCAHGMLKSYSYSGNCRAYWKCESGRSEAQCCPPGLAYRSHIGCVADASCGIECHEDWTLSTNNGQTGCDKRAVKNAGGKFEQYIPGGGWTQFQCAAGTSYSLIDCQCSIFAPVDGNGKCENEVYLPFDIDTRDMSGKSNYIINDNVTVAGGVAFFSGHSRILIPRFSTVDFGSTMVIKLKYKDAAPSTREQALVTNGDCGNDASVGITKDKHNVYFGVKTTLSQPTSVSIPLSQNSEWQNVALTVDNNILEGSLNGVRQTNIAQGNIQSRECTIQFGHGQSYENFIGFIDEVYIYLCRPSGV